MIRRPLFWFKDTKNTVLLLFNFLKQKKLIFNLKRAKILAENRKSHHSIETLFKALI